MRKIFVLISFFSMMLYAHAEEEQARLFVTGDVLVQQGGKGYLDVEMDFPEGHDYAAYQFTVTLPDGISFIGDEYNQAAYELPDNQPTKIYNVDFPTYNGIFKCYSNPTTIINANKGLLVRIPIQAEKSLAIGTRRTGTITNIHIAKAIEVDLKLEDFDFTTEVVEKVTVLDEDSTIAPSPEEDTKVLVKRTIKGGEWSTICLPFAMSEEQVKSAFGEDVQLGDFKGYKTTEDVDENIIGIKVNFKQVVPAAIDANHPYIIKVSKDITKFTVEGVDIDPEDTPTVAAVKRTKKQWSELIGTYVPITLENEMLFLSNNQFWYSAGQTKMKAFRAYFDFYDVLTEVEEGANTRIGIFFEEGETTGVQDVQQHNATGTYDLQGRSISNPKEGLYIQDGKKIIK